VKRLHFAVSLVLTLLLALPPLVAAQAKAPRAVITLEKGGDIAIDLLPADAPKTVESFVKLARDGFYDGTTFHRVVPGFVAQAGDPLSKTLPAGDPRLGTGGPGFKLKAEFNKQKHDRGVLAMARSQDPDSAGSQFYITLGPAPHLDGQYTVFGRVTSGMNVVDSIKLNDRIKTIKIVSP
jgi:peptidyl-prolyl cis-trans isomerase B (cyclophilin B)